MRFLLLLPVFMVLVCACGEKQDPVGGDGGHTGDLSFETDIKPLLDARCISCHASSLQGADRNGAPAGMDFDSFDATRASAAAANGAIQAGTMPPAGPLSGEEKALFSSWVDGGLLP